MADEKKQELLLDDEEEFTLDEEKRSLDLTPENARFFRSEGGLISLELKDDGETKVFERVMLLRAFPITNPDEFISVREPTKRKASRAKEVGMIRRASGFDEATNVLFHEELDKRYFTPEIYRIHSVKEKFSFYYWDVDTSAGHVVFLMNNPFNNIRILEDGRLFVTDMDGSVFVIPDPKKLDAASYRRIEAYL